MDQTSSSQFTPTDSEEKQSEWNTMMVDNYGDNGDQYLTVFGKLKVKHLKLKNLNPKINKILVVIPGLSSNSSDLVYQKLNDKVNNYLHKYFTDIYIFDLTTTEIEKINNDWKDRKDEEEAVSLEKDDFQRDISYLIDKIIRSFF